MSARLQRNERLARTIGRLRREMASRATRALARLDTPFVHWQLVSAIASEGLDSQIALAERVGMDPAGTSRALDALERAGLVRRARDAGDRRRVSVALTAKGRRWYEQARDVVFGELEPLFAPLDATEARTLEGLLAKLAYSSSGSASPGSV